MMIIDFANPAESHHWTAMNDGVMGGISSGNLKQFSTHTARFSGEISLENQGGFASVRRHLASGCLQNAKGVLLNVKGDGRTYQFRLKTDDAYDGIAYRCLFATQPQQWQTLELPFSDFCASFRGRLLPNAPALYPAQIKQCGFLLADKHPGGFDLEIAWIKAIFS